MKIKFTKLTEANKRLSIAYITDLLQFLRTLSTKDLKFCH